MSDPGPEIMEPAKLHKDAELLIGAAPDVTALVANLLRDIRQHRRTEDAITEGYMHSIRRLEDDVERAYVNGMSSVLDLLHGLTPSGRTVLSYDGFRGQAVRKVRQAIRWHRSLIDDW